MLREKEKALLAKLELPYPCVAIKFRFEQPAVPRYEGEKLAYCQYVKYAQDTGRHFYITADDDACYGRMALGMIDKPPVTASGQAGYDFGCYKSPVGCQQLYQKLPILEPHTINYVEFCPAADCDFDPDLLFFVADLPQADIIMRATSYISGDLWETKCSSVLSCAWMYSYPYVSGKVNSCITGMHHGMKRRKTYPAGRHIIAIPYQKINEVVQALEEMPWELIAMKEDPESKAELKARMDRWQTMSPDFLLKE